MSSERIQRRIDALFDEADAAADERDWAIVGARAEDVLAIDEANADAVSDHRPARCSDGCLVSPNESGA